MRVGILVFPGSNCDKDCYYAIETIGEKAIYLWHNEKKIPENIDMLIIPGGFSYGDYLRCGAIARFSPIMETVYEWNEKKKPILGICNGFQILTEAHILPGTLIRNKGLRFICKDVFLRVENTNTPFTHLFKKGEVIQLPIAHGEGNYYCENLKEIIDNNLVVFRYSDQEGRISEENNPNGSMENIAGITNKERNVLGMMPHPERAVENLLGSKDGLKLFESAIKFFKKN